MEVQRRFRDRRDAGRALAAELRQRGYREMADAIVLALPRGGVPVGYEVAMELHVPLDVFMVRKLGVPGHEELAMGAIASGQIRVLNHGVINALVIPEAAVNRVAREEQMELERREHRYRGDRPPPDVRGRTVVVVDDGLATGSTMRAATAALRQREPARIVVAVPVAAQEACQSFRNIVDDIVCPLTPTPFRAIGQWYEDFSQTTDEEVRELLERANREAGGIQPSVVELDSGTADRPSTGTVTQ